jgi:hypothetical protein
LQNFKACLALKLTELIESVLEVLDSHSSSVLLESVVNESFDSKESFRVYQLLLFIVIIMVFWKFHYHFRILLLGVKPEWTLNGY